MSSDQPVAAPSVGVRRPALLLAVAAGLCWACAAALLLADSLPPDGPPLAPERLIYYGLVVAASALTFVPAQRHLGLPGLAFEGMAGSLLLAHVLAFVPPPTGSLIWLPDVPVYLLLSAALFWCGAAVAMPFLVALGRRMFRTRSWRYDTKRARRQAHEIGLCVALFAVLAGLRVLTPLFLLLIILIVATAEMLLLSFVEAEGAQVRASPHNRA